MFEVATANYVVTKPLHGSQKQYKQEDGRLEVQLQLKINMELERLLLSFGETVEVIAPQKLREHIKQRIEKALLSYQKI